MNALDTARSNMARRLRADAADLDRQRNMDATVVRWAGFVKLHRRLCKAADAAPYNDAVYAALRDVKLKAERARNDEHRKLTADARQTDYRPPGFPASAEPPEVEA